MEFETYINKRITCPRFNCSVSLKGRYLFTENSDEAIFLCAKCEIVENSRLSRKRQNKSLGLFFCENLHDCKELRNFKEVIDISKDGYSQ